MKLGMDKFLYATATLIHLNNNKSVLHDYVKHPGTSKSRLGAQFGVAERQSGGANWLVTFIALMGQDVYYAPTISHCLLSGYQLTAAGCHAAINSESLKLIASNGALLAVMPIDHYH